MALTSTFPKTPVPPPGKSIQGISDIPSNLNVASENVKTHAKDLLGQGTTNLPLTDFYKQISDPMYSATDPASLAQDGGFKFDPIVGELNKVGGEAGVGAEDLAPFEDGQLEALSSKLSSPLPQSNSELTKLKKTAANALKNQNIQGTFGEIPQGPLRTLTNIRSPFEALSFDIPAPWWTEEGAQDTFSDYIKNNSPEGLADKLDGDIDTTLPWLADSSGSPIEKLPQHIEPEKITSLKDIASTALNIVVKDVCNDLPGFNFGFEQNLFNLHLNYLSDNDVLCLLGAYLTSDKSVHKSAKKTLSNAVLKASKKGSSGTVATIISGIGGGFIGNQKDVVGNLIRKGIKDKYNTAEIKIIANDLSISPLDLITETVTTSSGASERIYRERDIKKYDAKTLNSLTTRKITDYTKRNRRINTNDNGITTIIRDVVQQRLG